MKNIHKVLIFLGVITLVVLAAVLIAQNVKPGTKRFEKPHALTIIDDTEETEDIEAECPPEECGGDAEDESATDGTTETIGTTTENVEKPVCKKDTWSCTTWSECSADGVSIRTCTLKEDCSEIETPKPSETDSCTPPCTEDQWTCTDWTTCSAAGASTRSCSLNFDCPTAKTPKPDENKSCTPPPPPVVKEPVVKVPRESAGESQQKPAENVSASEIEKQAENEKKVAEEAAKAQEAAVQVAAVEIKAEAEVKIEEKKEEQKKIEEDVRNTVAAVPAFKELVKDLPPEALAVEPAVKDVNDNGTPDSVEEAAGIDPNKVDEGMVQFQAQLAVEKKKLLAEGKPKVEVEVLLKKKLATKQAEKKVEMVRSVAEDKYGIKVENSSQDTNGDGISDETEIILGLNPKTKKVKGANFSPAEEKIYGLPAGGDGEILGEAGREALTATVMAGEDAAGSSVSGSVKKVAALEKKCTMSVKNGNKVSSDGFTVLAACPKNQDFSLYAVDVKGRQTLIETKTASINNKIVFAVDKKFQAGKYMLQIRPSTKKTVLNENYLLTSAMDAAGSTSSEQASTLEASNPALVDVVDYETIPEPIVQAIEDIEIADLSDVKVTSTKDGKIRVTGLTDISTMVVGTFSSAVFTSAILADVKTGSFEITSAQQLEAGDHEVVIYASRPEESAQSIPIKVRFSIIQTASAASGEVSGEMGKTAEQFSVGGAAAVGGAVLLLIAVAAILIRRKKKV